MSKLLCTLNDLNETGSKGMTVDFQGQPTAMFVVKKDDSVFAYINNCPHAGAPLEWKEDVFLNDEGKYIVCGMHGALFEIENGICIDGPCFNQSLTPVAIDIVGEEIYLNG